jgi:hypothetical protein
MGIPQDFEIFLVHTIDPNSTVLSKGAGSSLEICAVALAPGEALCDVTRFEATESCEGL